MNTSTEKSSMAIAPSSYLHWLNFVQTLITLVFQVTSISLMSRLMFYRFLKPLKYEMRNMSKTIVLNAFVHIIGSILTIPHHLYLVLWWKQATPSASTDEPLYDPNVLYWTGMFLGVYMYAPPVPVFFLTLERCIALKFPVLYNSKFMRKKMPVLTFNVTITWCLATILLFLRELPIDMATVKYCESATCLLTKYHGAPQQYMKFSISALNILCTAYFYYALRTFNTFNGTRKVFTIKNRIVILTTISEVLLIILPMIFAQVFINVTGQSSANILGNYGMLLFTLDAVICSIYYEKTFMCKHSQDNGQSPKVNAGNRVHPKNTSGTIDGSTYSNQPTVANQH
ncbi:hypothetical protein DdX_16977 [Ditylenchus destructor]|uniref:Uncharacterized protein n=1 Tax=Ditylenchus destructor TaxID=166010 RepID=A0AAD4MPF9_9BILA|nr:hypothetical protein DdX_16977 [Ditylenchus destructor]